MRGLKCLVRQICDQNLHAAANTAVKHSEVYPEVLSTANKNASDKVSDYLKFESMLLQNLLKNPMKPTHYIHKEEGMVFQLKVSLDLSSNSHNVGFDLLNQ